MTLAVVMVCVASSTMWHTSMVHHCQMSTSSNHPIHAIPALEATQGHKIPFFKCFTVSLIEIIAFVRQPRRSFTPCISFTIASSDCSEWGLSRSLEHQQAGGRDALEVPSPTAGGKFISRLFVLTIQAMQLRIKQVVTLRVVWVAHVCRYNPRNGVPMRDETLSSNEVSIPSPLPPFALPPLQIQPLFFFTFWVMWASGPAALTASHTLSHSDRFVSLVTPVDRLPLRWEALRARILWSSSHLFENYHLQAQLHRSEGAFEGVARAERGNYAMIGMYRGSVLVFVHLQCFKHPDFLGQM